MSGGSFPFPACIVAGKGRIELHDVHLMRSHAYPQGVASLHDADALLALHRACPDHCLEWETYLIEALADFIVHQCEPCGIIDETKAGWLMRSMTTEGAFETAAELETVLHAMDLASGICDKLSALCLDQVRLAIEAAGYGVYRALRPPRHAIIPADIIYIRRVLRHAARCGRLQVSPAELDVLTRIDDIAWLEDHHPLWRELVDGLVMAAPARENFFHTSAWLTDVSAEMANVAA